MAGEDGLEEHINHAFKQTFEAFKKNYVALIVGAVIAGFGSIFLITIAPLVYGMFIMGVKAAEGGKPQAGDVFKGFNHFLEGWILVLTAGITVIIGLILLILPGIALMILYTYAIPIALIEKKGAIQSLQKSVNLGIENPIYTLIIWLFITIINSIGAALTLGWVITLPLSTLATILAYKQINHMKQPA